MKNRISTALAALACVTLAACSSVATLSTDTATALRQLSVVRQTRDQAYASKDIAGLAKFHAANLRATLADGTKLDRAGYESVLQKKMESGAPAPSHLTQLSQEEASYIAVAEGSGVVVRETWKKTGSGWKLKAVQEMSEESAIAAKKGEKKRAS
jgi:hypothetical protein